LVFVGGVIIVRFQDLSDVHERGRGARGRGEGGAESTLESNRIESKIGGVFFGGGCGLSWTTLTVGEKVPRGKR